MVYETRGYNNGQTDNTDLPMPKYVNEKLTGFGQRLAQLRKNAGYTQKELADEVGVTRRMIAYYESESEHLPASLLVELAQALNVTTDELLGVRQVKKKKPSQDTRLQRRFQQIEKMPARERRQLMQLIDTFLEAAQYRKSA